jgi:hypothetical protein
MYVCLAACKKGFKYGCRPILSLDASHLKEEYGGQLLCAIENYEMFPIAYALIEVETRASWELFIRILVDDIYVGSGEGRGWTIMSDRQKVISINHVYMFITFLFYSFLVL